MRTYRKAEHGRTQNCMRYRLDHRLAAVLCRAQQVPMEQGTSGIQAF